MFARRLRIRCAVEAAVLDVLRCSLAMNLIQANYAKIMLAVEGRPVYRISANCDESAKRAHQRLGRSRGAPACITFAKPWRRLDFPVATGPDNSDEIA